MLISSGLVLTSCGSGGETAPSPEKRETPEKVEIEKQGSLGDQTYGLFETAAKDKTAAQIKSLNALLKKVRALSGKSFTNNAARNKAIDDLNITPVEGIDADTIKAAMLADRNLDPVIIPFVCATGLKPTGEVCAMFKTAHEANAGKVEAIKTVMNVLKDLPKAGDTRRKLSERIANETSLAALINNLGVAAITVDAIKTAMINDSGLPVAAGLGPQGALGARTVSLFSDALDRDDTKAAAVNAVLAKVVAIDAANHPNKEARDAAVTNAAGITDAEIAAIGDATVTRDAIKDALQADKALLKAQGALGDAGHHATYDVLNVAATTAYGLADMAARNAKITTLNSIYDALLAIFEDAGLTSDGDRRVRLGGAPLAGWLNSIPLAKDAIGNALQNDKPLTEALPAVNPFAPKTATWHLFTARAVGADAATMTALNRLLARLTELYAKDFDQLKEKRDACIEGNAANCAVADDRLDPALLNGTNITAAQIKTAMQADKPLIVNLAESRLVHESIYDAIVGQRGASTAVKISTLIEAVVVAVGTYPETSNDRNTAIDTASGAAGVNPQPIKDAVNLAYPRIDIDAIFGAGIRHLKTVFVDALRNNPTQKIGIQALINSIEGIYREDDGHGARRVKNYSSKANIERAINGLGIVAVAGIDAAAIKAAWLADAAALPDVAPQLQTGFIPITVENTAVYSAIYNAQAGATPLSFIQKEMLFDSILAAAKIRPRVVAAAADPEYAGSRSEAVANAVDAAAAVAGGTAMDNAQKHALVNALDVALDAWQPASGADALHVRGAMPQNIYDAIVKSMLPANIQEPSNRQMNAMIDAVNAGIFAAHPQPAGKVERDVVVDRGTSAHLNAATKAALDALVAEHNSILADAPVNPGLEADVFAVVERAPITNAQKRMLSDSIFAAAKLRPRVAATRHDAVVAAVNAAAAVAGGAALDGAQRLALVTALDGALEAWQPATGADTGSNSYVVPARGSMPVATYNRVATFIFNNDLQSPANNWVTFMINQINRDIYNARPQPVDITAMNLIIDGTLHTQPWMVAWATEIKAALADPASGLEELKAQADYPDLHVNLYNLVTGATYNMHTNAQKNTLLDALEQARNQAPHVRLQTIVDGFRQANGIVAGASIPADRVDRLRTLLQTFRNSRAVAAVAGAVPLSIVREVNTNGDALIDRAGFMNDLILRKNLQQGVPLRVGDMVSVSPETNGTGRPLEGISWGGRKVVSGSGLLDVNLLP